MRLLWQLRTLGAFVFLTLFMVLLGFVIGWLFGYGIIGMSIMLVITVAIGFYSYWFSKSAALRANGVHIVTEQEEPRLYNTVRKVAEKAGLPMPEVGVSEVAMPNAFATGRNPSNAAVVATRGLLNLLNDDELEGVIGHEMSHVKNRDILVMSVVSTMVAILTYGARVIGYSMLFGSMEHHGGDREEDANTRLVMLAIGIIMLIFVPIAAMMTQLGISRSREYLADETGARITGKPLALASALRSLERGCSYDYNTYSDTARADMWITNPLRSGNFKSLFSTHPSTEERIRRLTIIAEKMDEGSVPVYTPDEDSSRSKLSFE